MKPDYDIVIVGGGFFGCCLALFLRSTGARVAIIEAEAGLLTRASRVNQARVHTGFHYPRSFTTAMRSRQLQERFTRDFAHAIVDDFDMLYAIAARQSKVSASRFGRMFSVIGAPVRPAPRHWRALFDPALIEEVFLCREVAFNWAALRNDLIDRLQAHRVVVRLGERVRAFQQTPDGAVALLDSGEALVASYIFNVSYSNLNTLAAASSFAHMDLKHEMAEIALVNPPPELSGLGVTVMDGPFFSTMPYPAEHLYSLTHVRYTPHYSLIDQTGATPPNAKSYPPLTSRWRHMIQDASRFLPCMQNATYRTSLFDVKTVLIRNERDDGRPILLRAQDSEGRIFAVLGAKIDNVYDLFEALQQLGEPFRRAHPGLLFGSRTSTSQASG